MENEKERMTMCCPYNGKLCVGGIREDFPSNQVGQKYACRMWVGIAGKLPDSEKVVYHYDCAFAWQVTTNIENSQTNRFVAASMDKSATEIRDVVGAYNSLSKSLRMVGDEFKLLNENIKKLPEPNADNIIEIPPNGDNGVGSEN